VASAIETFGVRLANAGFASSSLQCIFEDLPATVGYAATARVRSAVPPMEGHDFYYDRTDWWNHILATPEPRVVVMEDVDRPPGRGAFVGEVNANILMALGCAGLVTNGAVRDLNEVQQTGFQMFAGNVAVSHAYAHVFDFGGAVEVAGLQIRPGDLIQGDRHGVQIIPLEIAGKIPAVAHQIMRRRQHLIGLCRSTEFSVEKLRQAFKEPAHK
jgi:regulator of RNase E activity RraA